MRGLVAAGATSAVEAAGDKRAERTGTSSGGDFWEKRQEEGGPEEGGGGGKHDELLRGSELVGKPAQVRGRCSFGLLIRISFSYFLPFFLYPPPRIP